MSHSNDPLPGRAEAGIADDVRVYLVAAVAANGVIGAGGKLPWHLPEDLKHFKSLTMGHSIIMGRKTWESIGKPLPGRENIVVTRTPGYDAPGAHVAQSLEAALALCIGEHIVFVIGGARLFEAALKYADGLAMTEIHREFAGDAFFPPYDRAAWKESQRKPRTGAGGLQFDFVLYERARARAARRQDAVISRVPDRSRDANG